MQKYFSQYLFECLGAFYITLTVYVLYYYLTCVDQNSITLSG